MTTTKNKGLFNLDDENEIETFLRQSKRASKRAKYAREKQKAMAARKSGRIGEALEHEETCEGIYKGLSKRLKW